MPKGFKTSSKRRFTKRQLKWTTEYSKLCFDLEPMYMRDYLEGEMTFEDLQRLNIQWARDHFAEIIASLERIS